MCFPSRSAYGSSSVISLRLITLSGRHVVGPLRVLFQFIFVSNSMQLGLLSLFVNKEVTCR